MNKTCDVSEVRIYADVEAVIREMLATAGLLTNETRLHINPIGRFVIGGPAGDSGMTGREIIMDTHGRWDYDGYGCDVYYKRRTYTWRDAV
ncbi:MAG: methionine adenosyltransferase domain-containing protein [Kiritimatiellae bacterium]|nr:methionine adenosyltransferase domain-containing protein [Kiritimatiellia bacterium]